MTFPKKNQTIYSNDEFSFNFQLAPSFSINFNRADHKTNADIMIRSKTFVNSECIDLMFCNRFKFQCYESM